MSSPPTLTDRAALARHRKRADLDGAMFLHAAAIEDVQDRLSMVNRGFTKVAIVTGFPDVWRRCVPNATIVPDDDTLALAPDTYDLVIHGLSLHWANDPVGQLIQCRKALKADGFFVAAMFGGQTLNELRASLGQAEAEVSGGLSPRVAPMAEIRDLGGLLQRAGFALPVADSVPTRVTYETPWHLMRDLRAMGEANALASRLRRFTGRGVFVKAAEIYGRAYMIDGRLPATFETIFLTGWAPDASQPKPMRPGSAVARLADALGTRENPIKD